MANTVWERLRQRKLVQWALAYLAGAWVLLQVLGLAADSYEWPGAVMRAAFGVAAIGFLITLVLAWYHGERGAQRVSGAELLVVSLVLLVGGGLLWRFTPTTTTTVPVATTAAAPIAPTRSIAVLAFVDMSPGGDNGYLGDGIAEEILNALAKVDGLKVAGRTSSFVYKGRNEDMRQIGKELGVANVLEGSVRRQGDKVRITTQLVRAEDGFHLWSDTFDGDLSDVFALQERIARAVTDKLQVVLQAGGDAPLVKAGTKNAEAYELYLRATEVMHKRDYPRMGEAIGWLEEAIRLDPNFARAESRMAMLHVLRPKLLGGTPEQAQAHARRAIALDPGLAEPHFALGNYLRDHHDFVASRAELEQALALDPGDASGHLYLGQWLVTAGYTRAGITELDKALALDPMLPNALNWRAYQYLFAGDLDTAERMIDRADKLGLTTLTPGARAIIARKRGDLEKAVKVFNEGSNRFSACLKDPLGGSERLMRGVYGGKPGGRAEAMAVIDECVAARPDPTPQPIATFLLVLGEHERAFALLEGGTSDDAGAMFRFWGETGFTAMTDPAFPDFARKFGLAAAWDKYGPPDRCSKVGADWHCK
jgi:TolB-like protein/Tfp pilus assembly protein PilF